MNVCLGICPAIIAVVSLLKYSVDDVHRWRRLAVLILVVGALSLAALWTLRDTGGAAHHQPGAAAGISRSSNGCSSLGVS